MNLIDVDVLVDVDVLKSWFLKIIKLMTMLLIIHVVVKNGSKLMDLEKLRLTGLRAGLQALFFFLYSVYSVVLVFFDVFDDF